MNAHNIRTTGLCRVSGKHLSDASNEPAPFTEAELQRGDVANTQHKAERFHRTNDKQALQQQIDREFNAGGGW